MMNELKFRLRSLVTPSVDKYLAGLTAVVDSMDRAAEVNEERARRLFARAAKLDAAGFEARDESRRAERIADRFRELVN